jgi:RNA polymerase sigma-70 factor (ECF subfamily)
MTDTKKQQFLDAYDAHADALFRFCYALIGRREDAREATQEVFARAWRHCAAGKSVALWRPFLYRIARNIAIDHSRKGKTESLDALQELGFDAIDETGMDAVQQAESVRVVRCIASLERPYRDVIAMRYVDDMSISDIARIVGERENTVSVRIHRGLEMLRALMPHTRTQ